jgi:hypothetical protein
MSEPDKAEKPAKGGMKTSSDDEKKKSGGASSASTVQIRNAVATAVWLLAVVAAVLLAIGALFVVLDFNRDNGLVKFFIHAADNINILGTLKEFEPDGKGEAARHSAEVKNVLVNWGICAVVYLVVGKVLERLIRP